MDSKQQQQHKVVWPVCCLVACYGTEVTGRHVAPLPLHAGKFLIRGPQISVRLLHRVQQAVHQTTDG